MMPTTMVRLSAGRTEIPREAQLMCLYAGANSIFYGEKLLTTPNPEKDEDTALLREAGLVALPPVADATTGQPSADANGSAVRANGETRAARALPVI
jgi:biotin synthase-like enzyme